MLFGVFLSSNSLAQKEGLARIDSLLAALSQAQEDSNKVNLLVELGFTSYSVTPDNGIRYGLQALALAEKLEWQTGIARANATIGLNYAYGKSNYPVALEYFLAALPLFEKTGDTNSIVRVLSSIGDIHRYQSDYAKALEYHFKALHLAEEAGDKKRNRGYPGEHRFSLLLSFPI
jgi:tetratricopeptide (TPR) repeat protein